MYTGYKFRSRLSPSDVAQIRKARDYFHLTSLIPLILYYLKTSEERTKFPATISFTIRKGIPRAAHHVLWYVSTCNDLICSCKVILKHVFTYMQTVKAFGLVFDV